jgi:hypothetical protein
MTSFIIRLIAEGESVAGIDRDSASLLLLTAAEAFFSRFYLGNDKKSRNGGVGKRQNASLSEAGS